LSLGATGCLLLHPLLHLIFRIKNPSSNPTWVKRNMILRFLITDPDLRQKRNALAINYSRVIGRYYSKHYSLHHALVKYFLIIDILKKLVAEKSNF
jgi:hypothetical protein